jgi:ornithine decarboxylase
MADCQYANNIGVSRSVVDSPEEIDKIAKSGWNPEILIRLAVDDSASRSPFSIKFGAEKSAWHKLIRKIYDNNLTFCGLSFHVGSASKDPKQFRRAIEQCRAFAETTGEVPKIVDIGGGFMPETFSDSAREIRFAQELWALSSTPEPKLWISEPGRFFSSITHTLYVPIMSRKDGPRGKGYRYILDESIYGQFSCIPFDHAKPHWLLCDESPRSEDSGFVFGRTCDSIDLIAYSEKMPVFVEGDWLCFPEMGAYTTSSSSEFNGFPKPQTYYQEDGWIEKAPQNNNVIFPIEATSSITLSI